MTLEDSIQITFFAMLKLKMPDVYKYTFHVPNGGFRNITTAARLKKMGVKPGVADVFVMLPEGGYSGLWIEFKSAKGKQSDYQKEFELMAVNAGYEYRIARSPEDGIEIIREYLKINASTQKSEDK